MYKALEDVLMMARNRAAAGKGRERHGTGEPFHQQPICQELRHMGLEPAIYQVRKKALELLRFKGKRARDRRTAELLDIIVYAAAAVIVNEEGQDGSKTP
ncbi:hypothetical protein [Candidatus Magnetobacterium casense]|uniref:Uncharacterized protein n=1 Tax=Candidatus Magnetobacterium casense TaxID=1455061 RepID=A0ABS6S380_9BACT|nr:hypothetical protein [Candidatus Magnetobacterium casensis]MBV6343102.1 hypothetical protein [Candidatus Magnetobacterium casensis]